jgi:hypothetical protein
MKSNLYSFNSTLNRSFIFDPEAPCITGTAYTTDSTIVNNVSL